jgi:hypothetical protein
MGKSDEYRANAAECERMAGISNNQKEKVTWLQMAAHWLRLIPAQDRSASDKFEDREKAEGTHQTKSGAEH